MTVPSILVEVCIASVEMAMVAEQAGAHRLELNTALELDGLSPTPALLTCVLEQVELPVITMARPRSGDFVYSDFEWKVLKEDAAWMLDMGASGIAVGCLQADGQIDRDKLEEIRNLAHGKELVFHLAFDETPNWQVAMATLAAHGVNRVMTRGRAKTAIEGAGLIREMIEFSEGTIEVLPAGRVGSANVREIVIETGCSQVHGSFSSQIEDIHNQPPFSLPQRVMDEIETVVENLRFC